MYTKLFQIKAHFHNYINISGLPRWCSGKESSCQSRRHGFDSWVGKIPWRRISQCSCLGNPMHRGAERATVHGVTEPDTVENKHLLTYLLINIWSQYLPIDIDFSKYLVLNRYLIIKYNLKKFNYSISDMALWFDLTWFAFSGWLMILTIFCVFVYLPSIYFSF